MRAIVSIALLGIAASFASAQTTGDSVRGSTPPGSSQDGARPADGAIKGGSILPGESAGLPNKDDPTSTDARLQRCYELTGTLRDECVKKEKERSAVGGSTLPVPPKNETTDILKK